MLPAINCEASYSKLDASTPNGEDHPGRMGANTGEDFYEGVRAALRRGLGAAPKRGVHAAPRRGVGAAPERGVRAAPRRGVGAAPKRGVGVAPRRGSTPPPGMGRATSAPRTTTAGWVPPLGKGLGPPHEAPRRSQTTAAGATGISLAGWQGGRVLAQGNAPPPAEGR